MYKAIFSSFILLNAAVYADSTPTFNGAGTVTLPYVATTQGPFSATLQINPGSSPLTFTLAQVSASTVTNTISNPPSFNFNTGVLTIPKIDASGDSYAANLQLNQNLFTLTDLGSYAPPQSVGCTQLFPANNYWNTPIDTLPLHPNSAAWISSVSTRGLHPDFGSDNGQPINLVTGSATTSYAFSFQIPNESDPGPYPIPSNYVIQNTSDNLLLTIDQQSCYLYEVYNAQSAGNKWTGRRGAVWNLNSNALRPLGWAAADEGGLPYTAGLVRYDEVASGIINHAIRFTYPSPNFAIWPARHIYAGGAINNTMPLGARLRLKSSFNISAFSPQIQVILQAMKTYGIVLADTGSSLYISGTQDSSWNDDILHALTTVTGNNFEAVDSTCMMVDQNSGQANTSQC